jgi:hypothetical protein
MRANREDEAKQAVILQQKLAAEQQAKLLLLVEQMTERYGDDVAVARAEYDMKLAQVVRRTSKSKERPTRCSLCVDSISPYDDYVHCP